MQTRQQHPYPIVEERTLAPVRRRLGILPGRRDPNELPEQRPGTALVFNVNGRYEEPRGASQNGDVVDAVSVTVVDASKDRLVTARVELPSNSPADIFVALVTFHCTVTDAAVVVSNGVRDLTALLAAYLGPEIRTLGQDYQIAEVNSVRELTRARVAALCAVKPPRVEGIAVTLADVDVLVPEALARFEMAKRDELWRQELETLKGGFTLREAVLFEEVMARGPEAMEALALKLDQIDALSVAKRGFEERDSQQRRVLELLRILAAGGHTDRIPIDTMRIVDDLVTSLTGRGPVSSSESREAVEGSPDRALPTPRAEDEPEPLNEDET